MNISFNTKKFLGIVAVGTLASAAVGALLSRRKGESKIEHMKGEVKNMTRSLEKKARKQAKNLHRDEWIENEKEKIMSHAR